MSDRPPYLAREVQLFKAGVDDPGIDTAYFVQRDISDLKNVSDKTREALKNNVLNIYSVKRSHLAFDVVDGTSSEVEEFASLWKLVFRPEGSHCRTVFLLSNQYATIEEVMGGVELLCAEGLGLGPNGKICRNPDRILTLGKTLESLELVYPRVIL